MDDKIIVVIDNRRYEMSMLDERGALHRKQDFIEFLDMILPDAEVAVTKEEIGEKISEMEEVQAPNDYDELKVEPEPVELVEKSTVMSIIDFLSQAHQNHFLIGDHVRHIPSKGVGIVIGIEPTAANPVCVDFIGIEGETWCMPSDIELMIPVGRLESRFKN